MLKQNFKIFFLFVIIVAILVLFKNGNIFDVGSIFRHSFGPQQSVNSFFNPPDDLAEDYKRLLVENSELRVLEDENKQLKSLLDLKKDKQYNLITANIINRDQTNRNILIIDAGEDQGIKVGQPAVVNNGIIIGKVIDVGVDFSKVRLLIDSFSKLAVKVGEQNKISGMLVGSLGLGMDLTYIPQEQEIKKGDLVVTADLDTNIAPGLVVGQVEEIEFSQEEVFKKASVSPIINYETISILAIISPL